MSPSTPTATSSGTAVPLHVTDPAALREVAERTVCEAAQYLAGLPRPWLDPEPAGTHGAARGGRAGVVATKSTVTDVVTAADIAVEELVRSRLDALRPGDAVVGEEQGGAVARGAVTWVVDPIDGTTNFLYGLPGYAVSLAATYDGVSVAGAVAEPETGRLWSAAQGCGATCDGRPLRPSGVAELAMALLGTGFSYSPERRARQASFIGGMLPKVRDLRRSGSSALDVCAVAAGRLDAFVEHGPRWWDWAAASLVAREAGAVVRVPGAPGQRPPDDGLGADVVLVAAPGVAAELVELARDLRAAEV